MKGGEATATFQGLMEESVQGIALQLVPPQTSRRPHYERTEFAWEQQGRKLPPDWPGTGGRLGAEIPGIPLQGLLS